MSNARESNNNRELLPPPRLMPNGELRAIIEPPLRDMLPFPGSEEVDEWELFASDGADHPLTAELVRQAQETALADERVRTLLTDKRYVSIGASLVDGSEKTKESALLFIIYDYTSNYAIEVILDRTAGSVSDVVQARYQPAPLQEEIEQAIARARNDGRLADQLTDDLEGTAILVSPIDPDDPNYAHRQFDVRFGYADERLPRYAALVDLSTETVIRAGVNDSEKLRRKGGSA